MIHIVIWSLIGFIMGAGIVWLADRLWLEKIKKRIQDTYTDTINALSIEKATYVERVEHSDAVLLEMKEVLGSKEKQLSDTLQDVSKLQTENTHLREKLTTQKSELEQIQKTFHSEFENLANKILEEKSRKFTEQNKENLGQLLLPLSEKIKDFQKRVEETYDKESKQRFSLEKEIQHW